MITLHVTYIYRGKRVNTARTSTTAVRSQLNSTCSTVAATTTSTSWTSTKMARSIVP